MPRKVHVDQQLPTGFSDADMVTAVWLFLKEHPEHTAKVDLTDDGKILVSGAIAVEFNHWCCFMGFRSFEETLGLNLALQKAARELD